MKNQINRQFIFLFFAVILISSNVYLKLAYGEDEIVPPDFAPNFKTIHIDKDNISNYGAASYKIPIPCLPGAGGKAVPDLSLVYNSQVGNGISGKGWSLKLGSIERSKKKSVSYVREDESFLVNGSMQLIPRPDWGANYFGSEIEGRFIKYTYNRSLNYWQANTPDGTIYRYGYSRKSRQDDPDNYNRIFKWCLDRIEDTNGNFMEITYNKDKGQIYPKEIKYSGNRIKFNYDKGRHIADSPPMYDTKFKVMTDWILKEILIYGYNDQLSRKYSLDYERGDSSGCSRLNRIEQYGSDVISTLPAIKFKYLEGGTGHFGTPVITPTGMSSKNYLGDFNGDGRTDIVKIHNRKVYTFFSNSDGSFAHAKKFPSGSYYRSYHLADMNGDGRCDIFYHRYSNGFISFSNGNGTYRTKATKINITDFSGKLYLADVNGDGCADYVRSGYNGLWTVLLSDGNGGFGKQHRSDLGYHSGIAQFADLNGDGCADLIIYSHSNLYAYISNGDGTFKTQKQTRIYYSGELKCGDVNGDGFDDVVRCAAGKTYTYLSKGNGKFAEEKINRNFYNSKAFNFLGDVNGDGRADHIKKSYFDIYTYLSNGDGTFGEKKHSQLDRSGGKLCLADFNGDGHLDLLRSYHGDLYVSISQGNSPDLLTRIDNGVGGSLDLIYEPSSSWPNHNLPFVVYTVKKLVINDGIGNHDVEKTYTYRGAFYDYYDRQFWGFENITKQNPDKSVELRAYHMSPKSSKFLRNKLKSIETKEAVAGDTLFKTTMTWDVACSDHDLCPWAFVKLSRKHTEFYDSGVVTAYNQTDYTYDERNGKKIRTISKGTNAGNIIKSYNYINKGSWIWRLKCRTLQNSSGKILRQTEYTYDKHGNMISKIPWLDTGGDPVIKMEYDNYGNLISKTDAMGNQISYVYDPLINTYLTQIVYPMTNDGKTHVIHYTPNYEFGKLATITDERRNSIEFTYDSFGRLIRIDYPDSGWKKRTYFDSEIPRREKTEVAKNALETIITTEYYDGLNRKIESIKKGENAKSIVTGTYYDKMGRVYKQEGPFFGWGMGFEQRFPSNAAYVLNVYDKRGRPVKIIKSDGTTSGISTVLSYKGLSTTKTDPDGNRTIETKDYLGRIKAISEEGGHTTRYYYNAADDLERIEAPLNIWTEFSYDSLGRKIFMSDPDIGDWHYTYDANGNLLTEAGPQEIFLPIRIATEIYFSYDEMNQMISERKAILEGDSQVRTTSYEYDLSGKLIELRYPDANTFSIEYHYYKGSNLLHMVKDPDGITFATLSDYTPFGKIGFISHPNGTATTFTYDQNTSRLIKLTSTRLKGTDVIQEKCYRYSKAGDITSIIDKLKKITYHFTYDGLHRLKSEQSSGVNPDIFYTYDAVGNITEKVIGSDIYTYDYGTAFPYPHALETIAVSGKTPHAGFYEYDYDRRGNMISGPDFSNGAVASRTLSFYPNNMTAMVRHSTDGETNFHYDGMDNRIKKSHNSDHTYYYGKYFEVNNGIETKYIYAGNLRVAEVSNNSTRFFHKDHIGSSILMTNSAGEIIEKESAEYRPYGDIRKGKIGKNRYKYTDQEFDKSTGLYNYNARMYDPIIGRFISADTHIPSWYDPQSLNRYAYCRNNPLKYVDSTGHEFFQEVFYGDYNTSGTTWGGIAGNIAIGLTPLGWISDARDTSAAIRGIWHSPKSLKAWEGLGVAALSWAAVGDWIKAGKNISKVDDVLKETSGHAKNVANISSNEVPDELARVISGKGPFPTLGNPKAEDVFVTAADDIKGLDATQISKKLTIPESESFTVIKFKTPQTGLASPINRYNPGFVGGGRTGGGVREFVLPNQAIPKDSIIEVIK
ncbi:MAG: polymorphic toxin type 10 domain-containing protein [Desulfobacterales bacterium]